MPQRPREDQRGSGPFPRDSWRNDSFGSATYGSRAGAGLPGQATLVPVVGSALVSPQLVLTSSNAIRLDTSSRCITAAGRAICRRPVPGAGSPGRRASRLGVRREPALALPQPLLQGLRVSAGGIWLVPSRHLPFPRLARLPCGRFRLIPGQVIHPPPASRSAGTPSACASRSKAGTPGQPRPFSQWRKVLTGPPAVRASSARDRPAALRKARRCPPKLRTLPRCPATPPRPQTRRPPRRRFIPRVAGMAPHRHRFHRLGRARARQSRQARRQRARVEAKRLACERIARVVGRPVVQRLPTRLVLFPIPSWQF